MWSSANGEQVRLAKCTFLAAVARDNFSFRLCIFPIGVSAERPFVGAETFLVDHERRERHYASTARLCFGALDHRSMV